MAKAATRPSAMVESKGAWANISQFYRGGCFTGVKRLLDTSDAWEPRTGPQLPTLQRGEAPEFAI